MENITPTKSSEKVEKEATLAQASRLIDFFKEKRVTVAQVQRFIEAGDLVGLMLECPDLTKVDREEFARLFQKYQSPQGRISTGFIPLTPVDEIARKISARSEERKWGFTAPEIEQFAASVYPHKGDLHPTSADMWLGRDFAYNWAELVLWFKDELKKFDLCLKEDPRPNTLDFASGSEITGKRYLRPVTLDLQTNWAPRVAGLAISNVFPTRKRWPSLQPLLFHCLNPQLFGNGVVDGKLFPDFLVLGVSFDDEAGGYTRIGRSHAQPCIQYKDLIVEGQESTGFKKIKTGHTWFDASMVAFEKPSEPSV